jgi:Cu+-exporting ATPase
MDLLVAVGITAAFGYSLLTLVAPTLAPGPAHFAGSVMLILFIRSGRSLEARVRGQTTTSLDRLAREEVGEATLIRWDGSEDIIPADGLRLGDTVLVRAGERFPADGVVTEGESEAEEAFLTGEPLPRPKAPGDRVLASSLNGSGRLLFKVDRIGSATLHQRILELAQDSLMAKPPIQRYADEVAAVFVPAVLGLSAMTFFSWLLLTGDFPRALTAATAVVVVACPCALGLATPTAIMVASGVAAKLGLLFRSGGALETMSKIDRVAFDKTGTLTHGEFSIQAVRLPAGSERSKEEALKLARRLEAGSNHPLARAFRLPEAPSPRPLEGCREVPGRGVEAGNLRLGSWGWMEDLGTSRQELENLVPPQAGGPTPLFLRQGNEILAAFELEDQLREESPAVLVRLKGLGLSPTLLSGDRSERAHRFAQELGIEGEGELLPEDKLAWIKARQQEGLRIAFVGDGVNDAPALAQADLGIALGEGSALARESGDLILLSGSLTSLVDALELSNRTMSKIRQNLGWAVGYNLFMVPLAAGVFYPWTGQLLPPYFAGLAMALSSVSVVGNSLLLGSGTRPLLLRK